MKVLALSGSLRQASFNSILLRHAARRTPTITPKMSIHFFDGLGDLPLFNPDIEMMPMPVSKLYQAITTHDAILIASPEYAHGVTAVIKNALDWMVGNDSFVQKPTIVWNASPRAHHAHEALMETLQMMSTNILSDAVMTLPILGQAFISNDQFTDEKTCALIDQALVRLFNSLTKCLE